MHPEYALPIILPPCNLKELGRDAERPWEIISGLLEIELMCGCKIGKHDAFLALLLGLFDVFSSMKCFICSLMGCVIIAKSGWHKHEH